MKPFPTADEVARVIVSACSETLADPEAVLRGEASRGGRFGNVAASRARAYAAYALRTLYGCSNAAIGAMVGAKSAPNFVSSIEFQRRQGYVKWWSDEALARVIAAVKPVDKFGHVLDEARVSHRERLREADYPEITLRKKAVRPDVTLTSEFCGDPPPERSALGQKERAGA